MPAAVAKGAIMFCRACGAELAEDSVYCAMCGTKCAELQLADTTGDGSKWKDLAAGN